MIDSKRILVTGSSGYIGQHLVKLLKKEGYEVFGTDIKPCLNDYLLPKHFLSYDITNGYQLCYSTILEVSSDPTNLFDIRVSRS